MRWHKRFPFAFILLPMLVMTVWASPPQQAGDSNVNLRIDLEILADAARGEGNRPEAWTFNVDAATPTFVSDLWFDNELLANDIFGVGVRPPEWFGAPVPNGQIVARNVRHDLELAADEHFGGANRPEEWNGAAPIFRCERDLQNLVNLLADIYGVILQTPASALNYCQAVTVEAEGQLARVALSGEELVGTVPELVLAVRGDLERLADERLGLNTRPDDWIGNRDITSPTLAGDNYLDIEVLADDQLGQNQRPPDWIGVGRGLTTSPVLTYRNMRHDLELLADATMGLDVRPRGWQGQDLLTRCDPLTQDLVFLAQQAFSITIQVDADSPAAYCLAVTNEANLLAEAPPVSDVVQPEEGEEGFLFQSEFAFTYLDPAAMQYMGIMPRGIRFRPWYRNFGDSTMMFVSGEDFAVYIDRRWTTMSQDVFDGLPTTEGVRPLTFCDAAWCNGPGPTPTPTGAGAIQALIDLATPPAPPSAEEIANKTQVSWNNIRVTYLSDNAQTRTAQVTLEICQDTAQTVCEPVIRVFDNGIGAEKQVISQLNGLNVYEFAYGYTANLTIEGATLVSPDVWISDPTIR
jgi:hypothetical protein